jgi:D-alanyl-D-alanine carboxypeptidase
VFVKEMNRVSSVFHLKSTKFSNPHGLSDKGNRSTSSDIASLAYNALKNGVFSKIVNTIKYECLTYIPKSSITSNSSDIEEIPYKMVWYNSNKLL